MPDVAVNPALLDTPIRIPDGRIGVVCAIAWNPATYQFRIVVAVELPQSDGFFWSGDLNDCAIPQLDPETGEVVP
jgi:hypothetical protein